MIIQARTFEQSSMFRAKGWARVREERVRVRVREERVMVKG